MNPDAVMFLAEAARTAPSADNSQPVQLSQANQEIRLSFSQARSQGKLFGPASNATLLAVGCSIENICQAASAIGMSSAWRQADDLARGDPFGFLSFSGCDNGIRDPKLPLFCRHTNRFPFKTEPLDHRDIEELGAVSEGDAHSVFVSEGKTMQSVTAIARVAAEARFCTQELHNWLMGSLRFSDSEVRSGDGLDVNCLDLPPGGRLFLQFIGDWRRMALLNRIGAYKALAFTETLLLRQAPAFMCIIGRTSPAATIDAGRVLERVWIRLNALGYAVHPYYVITDQLLRLQQGLVPREMVERIERVASATSSVLQLGGGETLHMLLRVGRPKVNPKRSLRLPLATVFSPSC